MSYDKLHLTFFGAERRPNCCPPRHSVHAKTFLQLGLKQPQAYCCTLYVCTYRSCSIDPIRGNVAQERFDCIRKWSGPKLPPVNSYPVLYQWKTSTNGRNARRSSSVLGVLPYRTPAAVPGNTFCYQSKLSENTIWLLLQVSVSSKTPKKFDCQVHKPKKHPAALWSTILSAANVDSGKYAKNRNLMNGIALILTMSQYSQRKRPRRILPRYKKGNQKQSIVDAAVRARA